MYGVPNQRQLDIESVYNLVCPTPFPGKEVTTRIFYSSGIPILEESTGTARERAINAVDRNLDSSNKLGMCEPRTWFALKRRLLY